MVLPILIWTKRFLPVTGVEEAKTHREKVLQYAPSLFNLSSQENKVRREQFLLVVDTILADMAGMEPGLEWMKEFLPKSHDHPHKKAAKMKSETHIECTINLSEMEISNKCSILESLLWRYLCLLSERL